VDDEDYKKQRALSDIREPYRSESFLAFTCRKILSALAVTEVHAITHELLGCSSSSPHLDNTHWLAGPAQDTA
jgi:hypothetical protein